MEELKDQFVSLKNLTHKGLANVVQHMIGIGMKADFTSGVAVRDWARYYAVSKTFKPSPVIFRASLKIKSEERKKDLTEK